MEAPDEQPSPYAVEMIGISKRFGSLEANSQVYFDVQPGEIHCLVGENGAGKTTLMNILYGLVQPDEGQIRIFGKPVQIQSPLDARKMGIGMVHQHFMLVDSYSVAENVVLGFEPKRSFLIDRKKAERVTAELSQQYGLALDPRQVVRDLPVGIRQRVEILKVLYRGSNIIVLDEPTAVLTPQESQELFSTISSLVRDGKTIIFITHKLKEVMAVADRVTVMRRGKRVGLLKREEVNEKTLSTLMVGRELIFQYDKASTETGEKILQVQNLTALGDHGNTAVNNVSFDCRRGEIVTIAGVEGNGQTELIEAITGLRRVEQGKVLIDKKEVQNSSPQTVRQAGLSHVPADRIKTGLCIKETLEENLIAGRHSKPPYCRGWLINSAKIRAFSERMIQEFDIRADSPEVLVQNLSGGNMQKAVLAREIGFGSDLLVAVYPTRGVDVAAIESIHRMLLQARDQKRAILVVSTDLDEVFQLSDRILVMYNGEIVGEFLPRSITREELGSYMIGARRSPAPAQA